MERRRCDVGEAVIVSAMASLWEDVDGPPIFIGSKLKDQPVTDIFLKLLAFRNVSLELDAVRRIVS